MTAAVILAIPVASAMGAAAGVQDDRLPVTAPADLQARVDTLKSTGTKVTRVDLYWGATAPVRPVNPTDPNDPAYNWQWADTIFSQLQTAGITPIVTTWNGPAWATGGKSTGQPTWNANGPVNAKDYANFMQAVATRYNGKTNIPGFGPVMVKHYEVWNEPNLQLYMRPQYKGKTPLAGKKYAQMVNLTTPVVRAANSRAIVIAGVTGPKGKSDSTGRGTIDWYADLKKAGMKTYNAISQHIYPAAAPTTKTTAIPSWSTFDKVIQAVNTLPGGSSKKIYVTESSYTTAKTPYRSVSVTPSQQATYLKQIWTLPVVKSSRVPLVMWFQLQDNPNWPGGLFLDSGGSKPSLAAFKSVAAAHRPTGSLAP
ncbi:MAG: hypothetical protein JHC53_00535 [Thermoleophilia bacterium]|nr:hypothetical protein [Thermoleophilia bacterium]